MLCLLCGVAYADSYSDVAEDYWAYKAISGVSAKKWFGGYPDGTFKPDEMISRAEAAKVFVGVTGLSLKHVEKSSFSDVAADAWYAPYVEAAKELFPTHVNIAGETPFLPESPVTREDTVYAMVMAFGCMNNAEYIDESVLDIYSDKKSISESVKPYFAVAVSEGLVSGYADGTIRAQGALTRAEFATLLMRATEHGYHDSYTARIEGVEVFPTDTIYLEMGKSIILTARATYTDGKNLDYDAILPYDSQNSGNVLIEKNTLIGIKAGEAVIKFNSEYLTDKSVKVVVTEPDKDSKIVIDSYRDETEDESVVITGKINEEDITLAKAYCNGEEIDLAFDGSFSATVALSDGANRITFKSVNQYGLISEKQITITRFSKPIIKLDEYSENTTAKSVVFSGKVEGIGSGIFKCNGEYVDVSEDGSFSYMVNLGLMGENKIVFVAENKYGETDEKWIVITRYEFLKEK